MDGIFSVADVLANQPKMKRIELPCAKQEFLANQFFLWDNNKKSKVVPMKVCFRLLLCVVVAVLVFSAPSFAVDQNFGQKIDPEVPSGLPSENPPPPPPPNEPVQKKSSKSGSPSCTSLFQKDTNSAIFMVMKSWKCEDYDGPTLLARMINVYGKTSEDRFEIKGLKSLPKFKVTLNQNDVTLDEILDILGTNNGFIWGVDIPGKTIYFAPWKR